MNKIVKLKESKRIGFTLIELLLVIGIISVLASVVIQAVNPAKQLGFARDAQRRNDITSILNAFWQYNVDTKGDLQPAGLSSACQIPVGTAKKMCKADVDAADCQTVDCVYTRHLSGTYIVSIPVDPNDVETAGEEDKVDYAIINAVKGRIRIEALNAENADTILVER